MTKDRRPGASQRLGPEHSARLPAGPRFPQGSGESLIPALQLPAAASTPRGFSAGRPFIPGSAFARPSSRDMVCRGCVSSSHEDTSHEEASPTLGPALEVTPASEEVPREAETGLRLLRMRTRPAVSRCNEISSTNKNRLNSKAFTIWYSVKVFTLM